MPKLRHGNFYNFGGGFLTADGRATEALRTHFEMAGELLPLPYKGEIFTVLNVTECIDCLDHERTTWNVVRRNDKEIPVCIDRYVFREDRLSESPLIKIPEENVSSIFLVEGHMDPDEEFREIVNRQGLEGLKFEEVWSSQRE